jgi:hypothetical protein
MEDWQIPSGSLWHTVYHFLDLSSFREFYEGPVCYTNDSLIYLLVVVHGPNHPLPWKPGPIESDHSLFNLLPLSHVSLRNMYSYFTGIGRLLQPGMYRSGFKSIYVHPGLVNFSAISLGSSIFLGNSSL